MAYIRGEDRTQDTIFPVVLEDLIPANHVRRVSLRSFVASYGRTRLREIEGGPYGRPVYAARDMLKLNCYGCLQQVAILAMLPNSGAKYRI